MGDENSTYKPMAIATQVRDYSLSRAQAVAASAASLRDDIRRVVGSEPIIENPGGGDAYTLATYGAGRYVQISSFSIGELPGCCGVAVFYHCSVATDFQNKGLGKLLLILREEAARKAGYTYAQATVLKSNKPELAILKDQKWDILSDFKNRRTGHEVLVLGKVL